MSTQSDSYIENVQNEIIEILNGYFDLLKEWEVILSEKFNLADVMPLTYNIDQNEYNEEISLKINDVRLLQIRMCMVASMKAGKSTCINSFIGNECLSARSEAMTTIPTAVVLKLDGKKIDETKPPQLVFDAETSIALQNLLTVTADILSNNFKNEDTLKSFCKSHEDLLKTAKKLRDESTNLNQMKDNGNIQETLMFINDLMRIAMYLHSCGYNMTEHLNAFLKNIPAIHATFKPFSDIQKQFKQACQLLLIDTPGPNEAADTDGHLFKFVQNELKKADVILFLVEFGHLNTASDNQIAQQIKNIRKQKDNQDSIYVLVNKIDGCTEENMLKGELQQHVADLYQVPIEQIFLLSGKYALCAQKFFSDYQKNNENLIIIKESKSVRDVLTTVYPVTYKRLMARYDLDQVYEDAVLLYEQSGINNIIDSVLKTIGSQVAQRCMQSAIEVCKRTDRNLMMGVVIRLNGLSVLEKTLIQEINDMQQDLNELENIQEENISVLEEVDKSFCEKLELKFNEVSKTCAEKLANIFSENNADWYDKNEEKRIQSKVSFDSKATVGVTVLSGLASGYASHSTGHDSSIAIGEIVGGIFGWILMQDIMKSIRGTVDEIQFNSEQDAKTFIDTIVKSINKVSNEVCTAVEQEVESACKQSCEDFWSQIGEKPHQILRRASERLKNTFQINIDIPKRLETNLDQICLNIENIGYSNRTYAERIFRFITNSQVNDTSKWIISREKIKIHCSGFLSENMNRIKTNFINNVSEEMSNNFTVTFDNLKKLLHEYEKHINACLADKKLTQENQDRLKQNLEIMKENLMKKTTTSK